MSDRTIIGLWPETASGGYEDSNQLNRKESDDMNLKDKVAIVTGAAQGIGEAIALRLAEEGANLVLVDINGEALEQVAEQVTGIGSKVCFVTCNVTKKSDVENVIQQGVKAFGRIDILVNNAGVIRDALLLNMTEEEFDIVIAVNLKGPFLFMQAAAKIMKDQGGGKIINISSITAKVGNFGQINYTAAKGGMNAMSKTAARELAKYNITVNVVMPGFIDTKMTQSLPDNFRESKLKEIPLGRAGQPRDIANAVAFLASEQAGYVTGHVMEVTGGRFM